MRDEKTIIRGIDRAFEDMKAHKALREDEFQQIADYFMPRKDFSCANRPGDLRRRRLTSSVPPVSLRNSAAMLFSYVVDPTNPFISPSVENSLMAAGYEMLDLSREGSDWLERLRWGIHGRMMSARSGFATSSARLSVELWAFGTGVQWVGHKRGQGPIYQTRPFQSCWIRTNGDGMVDTVYYQFTAPLHWVLERWPEASKVDDWQKIASETDDAKREAALRQSVTLLHVVEPRIGGERGRVQRQKPFAEYYVCLDKKAVLEERGYDSFPYAVPRLEPEQGSDYGTGRCWHALPDAKALSVLQQAIENGVDLKVAPPIMMPKKLFGGPLDRRPGAANYFDPTRLGFMNLSDAVKRLELTGDLGVGQAYHQELIQRVEAAMLVDWMRLRDSGNVTAEEIRERRNLRISVMSAHVPGIDRDWMGVVAERTAEILLAEGDLGPVPADLRNLDVDWDYAGPLAQAQRQRQAEGFDRMFARAMQARELDPAAPFVLNLAEGLRACADAEGLPLGTLRSRAEVEAMMAEQAERAQAAEERQAAMDGAAALRDGAQGVASLANMGGAPEAMAA